MCKFLTIVAASFMLISSVECVQVIYSQSPNLTQEETDCLNQHQEQMHINRESLELQRQMLDEYRRNNRSN